jgi:aminodeoxyfutalosine synthase
MQTLITTSDLSKEAKYIYKKIQNGERLSKNDGLKLFEYNNILEIGHLADFARIERLKRQKKESLSNYVYWINNHHLNLTNICEGTCKFCAYRRKEGQDGAFLLTLDGAAEYIEKNVDKNVKEIHIVSALNENCNLEYYTGLLQICRKYLPNTHIQAFTAVEIDYIAKLSGITAEETLKTLKKAGLGSLPGGGAEIFSPEIRSKICPDKISGKIWLEIMETAHSLGLKSNATMLCGIGESYNDMLDHMLDIRGVQDKTGGFMTFIPLFCHYENTELDFEKEHTGIDILKTYAISRLMLDNVPHIKAFWIQTGIQTAQISLAFGVDDLDGTVVQEKITRYAGAKTGQELSVSQIVSLIKNTGKIPVERDTLYNILKVYK